MVVVFGRDDIGENPDIEVASNDIEKIACEILILYWFVCVGLSFFFVWFYKMVKVTKLL